jgi:hypothetical protein
VDCMRRRRHAVGEVIAQAHALLVPFRA